MIAVSAASSVLLLVLGIRTARPNLVSYLGGDRMELETPRRRRAASMGPALIGAVVGAAVIPAGVIPAALIGAVVGWGSATARARAVRARLKRQAEYELPAVADLIALYVLAGESVFTAIRRVAEDSAGVVPGELATAMAAVHQGSDLREALYGAAAVSSHPDADRLFRVLAEGHATGARLVESLQIFAADRRSMLARDLTEEGSRRAIAGYGPILGLMVPTTLVFLIYPTVAGLDALAVHP